MAPSVSPRWTGWDCWSKASSIVLPLVCRTTPAYYVDLIEAQGFQKDG